MRDSRSTSNPTSEKLPDTESKDYVWLLEKLGESMEQLRSIKGASDQQSLQLAQAAWRVEGALAAIRGLQAQNEHLQAAQVRHMENAGQIGYAGPEDAGPKDAGPEDARPAMITAGGRHQAMAQIRWRHS